MCLKRKTRMENDEKARKFLKKKKKAYLIGYWADIGIMEFYYSGKNDKDGMPLVWDYYDGNGTCDCWVLRRIEDTTTGQVIDWVVGDKEEANGLCEFWKSVGLKMY